MDKAEFTHICDHNFIAHVDVVVPTFGDVFFLILLKLKTIILVIMICLVG